MNIKGAIFDMDGTIVDSLMYWDYLWRQIGEKYWQNGAFRPDPAVEQAIRTMVYTDAMAYVKDACGIPGETEDFLRFTSEGITAFYRDVAKPKQGAERLLAYLKSQNVKLCLASATAMDEIRFALGCYGMLSYFDTVLSCADIGVGKDRPDIYLLAKDAMGLSPREICVFEDSYVALETAKAAGFQTVGVFDRYSFEQERLARASDYYLDEQGRLDDLLAIIAVSH